MNKSRLILLVPLALLAVYLFWEPAADEAEERDGTSLTIPGSEVVDVRYPVADLQQRIAIRMKGRSGSRAHF